MAFGKDFADPRAVASKTEFQTDTTNFWLDGYLTLDVHLNIDTLHPGDNRGPAGGGIEQLPDPRL
ncbi:hypothetical protein [Falsirhodobacter sp. 1013]|uniref:hypothetical protein n=1 Tax=Falsirhodobacter sp. 1013 TaxID=3417566 RepID=UPI003EBB7483